MLEERISARNVLVESVLGEGKSVKNLSYKERERVSERIFI